VQNRLFTVNSAYLLYFRLFSYAAYFPSCDRNDQSTRHARIPVRVLLFMHATCQSISRNDRSYSVSKCKNSSN